MCWGNREGDEVCAAKGHFWERSASICTLIFHLHALCNKARPVALIPNSRLKMEQYFCIALHIRNTHSDSLITSPCWLRRIRAHTAIPLRIRNSIDMQG